MILPENYEECTNEQLNVEAAEKVCGWIWVAYQDMRVGQRVRKLMPEIPSAYYYPDATKARGDEEIDPDTYRYVPNFCSDRNALPDLWAALETRHILGSYMSHLCSRLPKYQFNVESYIAVHAADPRLCVIAALEAIGMR